MESKIREHMEGLFLDAPPSKRAQELKEEMIQNLTDKYRDFTAAGKQPEVAYDLTIASIGDISELIRDLEESHMRDPIEEQKMRKKSALFTSVAVMLYILSPLPLIIGAFNGFVLPGLVLLLILAAAATGLLIYNGMSNPKYTRSDDTVVEEFREWQSVKAGKNSARKSVSGAIWAITIALYFIVSFTYGIWYISWVLFILAVAVEQIISAIYSMREDS